ncbi:putative quinol monooxygenase [Neobacillus cucumis]|uniref:putative quinol monooxygenase n=1 Tax=Neobacillus cucumis TaxID=1740721 RepID=UPI0028530292|nr:putative quinol monooxygenase [Neobacillus cucumis]MDR4945432.1 putative quinol monooxygenase [Neobacillus cucumis]
MGSIIVNAILKPKEGFEEQLLSELKEVQAASKQEKGCINYKLHKSIEDNTFVLYEEWENNEAIENHIKSNHYQIYRENISDIVLTREIHKLEMI